MNVTMPGLLFHIETVEVGGGGVGGENRKVLSLMENQKNFKKCTEILGSLCGLKWSRQ